VGDGGGCVVLHSSDPGTFSSLVSNSIPDSVRPRPTPPCPGTRMVPSPPHVPGSWAPLRPVERAAGPSLPRLRALAAFALLSVGCLLCNPLVLPPAGSPHRWWDGELHPPNNVPPKYAPSTFPLGGGKILSPFPPFRRKPRQTTVRLGKTST